jgi:hypothetical protein
MKELSHFCENLGAGKTDERWGMSAPKVCEKHRLDTKTIEIEAQNV